MQRWKTKGTIKNVAQTSQRIIYAKLREMIKLNFCVQRGVLLDLSQAAFTVQTKIKMKRTLITIVMVADT